MILYPHQEQGVSWMRERERARDALHIRGGIVGDEMGLGKTITVLECIRREGTGPTMIACPQNLVSQWESECDRLGMACTCLRTRQQLYDPLRTVKSSVVIVSHSCFSTSHAHFFLLNIYGTRFFRVVVDEAHMIRNHRSILAQNLCAFPGQVRWLVTGTPIVNVAIPPRSVRTEQTRTRDCRGYARFLTNNHDNADDIGKYVATHIHEIMLRRLKRDIWRPNTSVSTYHGCLHETEQRRYALLYQMGVDACENNTMEKAHIATLMIRLRQVCSAAAWKLEMMRSIIETLPLGTKSLVFCSFRDEIRRVKEALEGCVDVLMEYHGDVRSQEREAIVQTFREQTSRSMVIVIQIDCGGTGLNLQDAQHVFITSPTWAPSTERQAIGRADRATTRHVVKVHRFITSHSMESFMYNRQRTKDQVSQSLLEEDVEDICGQLLDANGLMPTAWNDLCDIETLFDM